jgi:hypothetical protein
VFAFAIALLVKPLLETMIPEFIPVRWHLAQNASTSGTPTDLERSLHSNATDNSWWPSRKVKTTSCSRKRPVSLSINRFGDSTFTFELACNELSMA